MTTKNMDILSVQDRAKTRRKQGYKVINGSAGQLYRDDKTLCTYSDINNYLKNRIDAYLAYPNPLGSPEFRENSLSWIFGDLREELEKQYQIAYSVSLGGTGALAMAFHLEMMKGGVVVLSDLNWPNYFNLAEINHLPFVKYHRFDEEGHFDFSQLKKGIETGLASHDTALVVLNDPCQNPTGYCFTKEEYQKLFDLLQSYGSKVTLLMDTAYFNYAPMGFLFPECFLGYPHPEFHVQMAFSTSKCFGLYGLRLGAFFSFVREEETKEQMESLLYSYARGIYSCPNNGAMGPVAEAMSDPKTLERLREQIHKEGVRLSGIGKALCDILDGKGIEHFPYGGGFFVTFKMKDALSYCLALEEKDIYLVPISENYIRVAISGLTKKEVQELGEYLHA